MPYVDGFLLPLRSDKLDAYRRMARQASKIWIDHGALEYRECIADEFGEKPMLSFRESAGAKRNETVIFAWIVYKTKAQRNRVNAAVMKDPRIEKMCGKDMPFSVERMAYGGFKVLVEALAAE